MIEVECIDEELKNIGSNEDYGFDMIETSISGNYSCAFNHKKKARLYIDFISSFSLSKHHLSSF